MPGRMNLACFANCTPSIPCLGRCQRTEYQPADRPRCDRLVGGTCSEDAESLFRQDPNEDIAYRGIVLDEEYGSKPSHYRPNLGFLNYVPRVVFRAGTLKKRKRK